jgi:hypothetical protein
MGFNSGLKGLRARLQAEQLRNHDELLPVATDSSVFRSAQTRSGIQKNLFWVHEGVFWQGYSVWSVKLLGHCQGEERKVVYTLHIICLDGMNTIGLPLPVHFCYIW